MEVELRLGEIGTLSFAGCSMAVVAGDFLDAYRAESARTVPSEPISRLSFAEFSHDILGNLRRLHQLHCPSAAIEDGGRRVFFLFSREYNQQFRSGTGNFHARFSTIRGPRRSAQRRL